MNHLRFILIDRKEERLENIKGASYDKTFKTAPGGERKTIQPAFARGKCTPFGTAGTSPGGGSLHATFLWSPVAHCLVSIVPPLGGWQGNWIRRETTDD